MAKYVKNEDNVKRTYQGQPVWPGEYYLIPSDKETKWANDDNLVADIFAGHIVVARSNDEQNDYNDPLEGLDYLRNMVPAEVEIKKQAEGTPFASKTLPDGRKLFKRVHGVFKTIAAGATDTIELIVPYTQAKINALEILGACHGDTANFNVYDNEAGIITSMSASTGYTAIPNAKLNQFGFNVCMRKDFHKEESQYDADVIQGMRLELEITNSKDEEVLIGANFILHELVS